MTRRFPRGGVAVEARGLPRVGYAFARRVTVPSVSNRFEGIPAASAAVSFSAARRVHSFRFGRLHVRPVPCPWGRAPLWLFCCSAFGQGSPLAAGVAACSQACSCVVFIVRVPFKGCAPVWRRCLRVESNECPSGTRRALMAPAPSAPDSPRRPCPVGLIFRRFWPVASSESGFGFALSLPARM